MSHRAQSTPRVAVLIDTSSGWGRRLIRGIQSYVRKHQPWDIWLEPRGQNEPLRLPKGWKGDGVIARVSTRQMAEHLAAKRIPTANVSAIRLTKQRFAGAAVDEVELARLAVDHFRGRGIRRLGYVGLPRRTYSLARMTAVREACLANEMSFENYSPSPGCGADCAWPKQHGDYRRWLKALPKPAGILTWDVGIGLEVIRAAVAEGIYVPDDIAVLSGDDDELLCETSYPTLSGILVPSEQLGYEAARLIDCFLNGKHVKLEQTKIEPTGVVARGSTDVLAIHDQDVTSAVRFIRDNADHPIKVSDVADAVSTSRRVLERRFQSELNRTLGEEIARAHLDRAKLLLAQTDLSIPKVADASGYGSPEYFAAVFRKLTGSSPLRYRSRVQGR